MKKCIYCNSGSFKKVLDGEGWRVVSCKKCGLFKTERDEDLTYSSYHRDEEYHQSEKQFENIFQKRIDQIEKYFEGKHRILEIGCSTGTLLSLLVKKGWECWGVEPSESSKEAGEKGIRVYKKKFEELKLPTNFFDVVVLNHTLEHFDNPLEALKKINKVLKRKGMIFVDVPNFASLTSKLLKKKNPFLLPLEHNYHFTKDTLEKLFKKAGFKTVLSKTSSGIFDYANPLKEIFQSLFSFKKRFFTNILFLPFSFLEIILDRGTNLSVVAKKRSN